VQVTPLRTLASCPNPNALVAFSALTLSVSWQEGCPAGDGGNKPLHIWLEVRVKSRVAVATAAVTPVQSCSWRAQWRREFHQDILPTQQPYQSTEDNWTTTNNSSRYTQSMLQLAFTTTNSPSIAHCLKMNQTETLPSARLHCTASLGK